MFYNHRRLGRQILARRQHEKSASPSPLGEAQYSGLCPCCGGASFQQKDILWHDLIDAWSLAKSEVDYINRQQGWRCTACSSRLRSMALADWLLQHFELEPPLLTALDSPALKQLAVLEVNEAGQLSQYLRQLPGHALAAYPDVDAQNMPYTDSEFDLVIHSDTLEHIPDPVKAMAECFRVLKDGGVCAFTVPAVVGRLSRNTSGLLASYHGHSGTRAEDFRVRTAFGSDTWRYMAAAGFTDCRIHIFEYPAAIVHVGVKTRSKSRLHTRTPQEAS